MEIKCRLLELRNTLHKIYDSGQEVPEMYEVEPTAESAGWRRNVAEYGYTVHIPMLKMFFRYAVEYEYDEETKQKEPMEKILHCYNEGKKVPYGVYMDIGEFVRWYVKENGLDIADVDEMECVIEIQEQENDNG